MLNLENLADSVQNLDQARQIIRELCQLVSQLQQQVEEVGVLKARIEELERGQSSRNSSRPPSLDSPGQRSQRPRRPRSDRQQGA